MVLRKEKQEDDGFCGRGRGATGVDNGAVGLWKGRRGAMKRTLIVGLLSVFVLAVAQPAMAVPTNLDVENIPTNCDPQNIVPTHELGNPPAPLFGSTGPFPPVEAILSDSTPFPFVPCPATNGDDPQFPDFLVEINNVSGQPWVDLYFVGEPISTFSNVDVTISSRTGDEGERCRIR